MGDRGIAARLSRLWRLSFLLYRRIVLESGLPGAARSPILFAGFVIREVWVKDVSTRAMALSFQLLFSLVPALTLMMSLLAFLPWLAPAREQIVGFLIGEFFPTDQQVILSQIDHFTENAQIFSFVGVVVLLYGAVIMVVTLDGAINAIWNIRARKIRWYRRISSFSLLGFVFLGGLAMGIVTSGPFQSVLGFLDRTPLVTPGVRSFVTGLVVGWVVFFAMYKMVPRTWVQTGSAAIAAGLASLVFSGAKTGFLAYASWSQTYTQIYGVLGVLFMTLLWVYVAWYVVLAGSAVAFVLQNYEHLVGRERQKLLGERYQTYYASRLLVAVYRAAAEGRTPIPVAEVAAEVGLAAYLADRLADRLAGRGLIGQRGLSHWEHLEPARPPAEITLAQVVLAVANDALAVPANPPETTDPVAATLGRTLLGAQNSAARRLADVTIAELLEVGSGEPAPEPQETPPAR